MSQSQVDVARQSTDIVLKIVATALGGDLFARFGLSLPPIVAPLPSELPQLQVRTGLSDLLFLLADENILHLECQTTLQSGDLERFANYNWAAHQHYKRRVITVVLYGAGITKAPDILDAGSMTFRPLNILVGQENGDAVLRRLQEKVERGEPFTPADRVDLILSPLMRRRRSTRRMLLDAADLVERLPVEQQELTLGSLLGLAYHYVGEKVITEVLGRLRMANPLQTLLEESRAEGRAEGQRLARRALRTALQARFGDLPESMERRIDAADIEELGALLARATTVGSFDEL